MIPLLQPPAALLWAWLTQENPTVDYGKLFTLVWTVSWTLILCFLWHRIGRSTGRRQNRHCVVLMMLEPDDQNVLSNSGYQLDDRRIGLEFVVRRKAKGWAYLYPIGYHLDHLAEIKIDGEVSPFEVGLARVYMQSQDSLKTLAPSVVSMLFPRKDMGRYMAMAANSAVSLMDKPGRGMSKSLELIRRFKR